MLGYSTKFTMLSKPEKIDFCKGTKMCEAIGEFSITIKMSKETMLNRATWICHFRGRKFIKIWLPSSGGTGIKFKIAKLILYTTMRSNTRYNESLPKKFAASRHRITT